MTNTKNSGEKTSKKIRYSMKRMAHNRNLEKSTRRDEENKKQNYWKIFLCKLCVMFTNLSGIVESELDYEIVTTESSRSYLNNGIGITQKQ